MVLLGNTKALGAGAGLLDHPSLVATCKTWTNQMGCMTLAVFEFLEREEQKWAM